MADQKFIYKCIDCGEEYNSNETIYLCSKCSKDNTEKMPPKGVLKVVYDYEALKRQMKAFPILKLNGFLDLLPINDTASFPKLKVGDTPLYEYSKLNGEKLPYLLYLKDDSQNPTFSFKDRASAMVSAFAKERRHKTIVAASTGNAGSSMAGICASANQKAIILVPENAPIAKITQIMMYGAQIIPVKGSYDDAYDLSIKASEEFGWYNRNTAYNPITIEGKKTVAFEFFAQLKEELPDNIFVPVGDGVIISSIYKGFEDLLMLGLIHRIPKIIAVQAEGSSNLISNLNESSFKTHGSNTIADSISVDIPRNFYMAKQYIESYNGESISVSDENIQNASVELSKNTGIFSEPASAAAFAGFLEYKKQEKIAENTRNIVLLTGSGLKDINAITNALSIPEAVSPDIENLKKFL